MSRKAKEEKAAAYKSAFEDEDVIIYRKVDFQSGISTLLYNAWKHRNSESHLYALLNYIQTIQSLTLLHKNPTRVIAPWPQPLFGTLAAPNGANKYPSRNASLPSNFYPDHARILVFGGKEQGPSYSLQAPISIALDSSEAKTLNTASWKKSESKRAAETVAESHLAQVCESSLAGLAHNPFWTSLYAFLIVGPYFSLFAWKTRPDAAHLEVLPAVPTIPKHCPRAEDKKALVAQRHEIIKQRIIRIKQTPLPEVIYYNQLMFDFGVKPTQRWYEQATLSRNYLRALSLPTLALSEELAYQPSWFKDGLRGDKYPRGLTLQQTMGADALRDMVINYAVERESDDKDITSDQPGDDLTLAGPKPPDSSDSQQSRFSEAEPQVVDLNAGPHQMRMRASVRGGVGRAAEGIMGAIVD